MSPAAAITTEALRLVEAGHDDVMAFALACASNTSAAPSSRRFAFRLFTAALRRRDR